MPDEPPEPDEPDEPDPDDPVEPPELDDPDPEEPDELPEPVEPDEPLEPDEPEEPEELDELVVLDVPDELDEVDDLDEFCGSTPHPEMATAIQRARNNLAGLYIRISTAASAQSPDGNPTRHAGTHSYPVRAGECNQPRRTSDLLEAVSSVAAKGWGWQIT